MTIYDPPTAEADRIEWDAYLSSLSPSKDAQEIRRVKAFIEKRFALGFDLAFLLINEGE